MKVLEARRMRLSEGICPACEKPLKRGDAYGWCDCCGHAWRLHNGAEEVCIRGEWLPGIEGPRGCHPFVGFDLAMPGADMTVTSTHTFHLATDNANSTTEEGR